LYFEVLMLGALYFEVLILGATALECGGLRVRRFEDAAV
jgi:hypothetical protein